MTARHSSPVPRLNIPAYDWGVNSIHGDQVACGTHCATNFPLPVAIGASFNMTMVQALGRMMGVELRSLRLEHVCEKHLAQLSTIRTGETHSAPPLPDACIGLDTWAPNININRDPRWGRNWEVASEDPHLTGQIGAAYARGFQNGEDKRFLLGVLTAKHWAAYNVEADRKGFNSVVPRYDLAETYLAAFRTTVRQGNVAGIMCSYNALNGIPTCADPVLNNDLLRSAWGFDGYMTSDSGAIDGIVSGHKYAASKPKAAAQAIAAGCDIDSGSVYAGNVELAVKLGLLNESTLDAAIAHAFRTRMRLGLFDPPEDQPHEHYGPEVVGSAQHHTLSLDASRQGMTLLANKPTARKQRALPLTKGQRVAVIGPNSDTRTLMAGKTFCWSRVTLQRSGCSMHECPHGVLRSATNIWGRNQAKRHLTQFDTASQGIFLQKPSAMSLFIDPY
eukprot:m.427443 g.427443  ORF g.427443 m.427443 type:complete len:447 (-) comp21361_c0_seq35:2680-4020(-)